MAISFETLAQANKSQEASFAKMNQVAKEEAHPQQIAAMVHTQNEQKAERTTATEQRSDSADHKDAKDKGSNEYQRQQMERRKMEQEKKKDDDLKKMLGCSFTISV